MEAFPIPNFTKNYSILVILSSFRLFTTFGKTWSSATIAMVRMKGAPQARREKRTNLKLKKLTKRNIFLKLFISRLMLRNIEYKKLLMKFSQLNLIVSF